jgi:hypothetical protein
MGVDDETTKIRELIEDAPYMVGIRQIESQIITVSHETPSHLRDTAMLELVRLLAMEAFKKGLNEGRKWHQRVLA